MKLINGQAHAPIGQTVVQGKPTKNSIAGDISGAARPETLQQAAVQFEALFLRSMLSQMRKAADVLAADDDPFNSKQQRMMRDFYDDTLATTLASQRSSGIADLLIQQLSGNGNGNGNRGRG